MTRKKTRLLIMLLLISVSEFVFSQQQQQIYRTIKGDIALTVVYKDTVIIATSDQLIATLDYDTEKLIFRVKYETFHTGIDSIDNKLKLLNVHELKFDGALNIFINPKKQTPQNYNMTGMMTSTASPFPTEGIGTVVCVRGTRDDAAPACKLTATIKGKLSELNLSGVFQNADNNVQIDLRQSLLEKEKVN